MQNNNFLYNFLISKYYNHLDDVLLYQVNNILFNFGDHQKRKKLTFKDNLIDFVLNLFLFLSSFFLFNSRTKRNIILSNAYVSLSVSGFSTLSPPWSRSFKKGILSSFYLIKTINSLKYALSTNSLKEIFSDSFTLNLLNYENEFSKLLIDYNVKGLIVANDLDLFNNFSIKIAKKNHIPTFVYLHGLPSRINNLDDNRADYLIVWGKGIKSSFVNCGVCSDRILTLKHPVYSDFKISNLKSNFNDVLVLSKPTPGTPIDSSELVLADRSKSLLYLEMLKSILLNFGLRNVRLRLHPSESVDFYKRNMTCDFFKIDLSNKINSLSKASLVIGPTSTMVLDAIKAGVNYILYEPKIDCILLDNTKDLVPPFDGLSFIKLSETIEEFKYHIENPNVNIDVPKLNQYFEVVETDYEKFIKILK